MKLPKGKHYWARKIAKEDHSEVGAGGVVRPLWREDVLRLKAKKLTPRPPKLTAKRAEEMEQLVNDIAENMNLRRWKRADLIECITWQQSLLCAEAISKSDLRMRVMDAIASDLVLAGDGSNCQDSLKPKHCEHETTK